MNYRYPSTKQILDKVKKGELEQSDSPKIFSNLRISDKKELVEPYLHFIDERALKSSVGNYIGNEMNNREAIMLAKRFNKKLNKEALPHDIQQVWMKFPKSLVNDIFNIYYNDVENLTFKPRTTENKYNYQLLEKASDPVIKVLTNKHNIRSMVFTRSLVQYYVIMLAMLMQDDYEAFKEMSNQLDGKGSDGTGESESGKSNEEILNDLKERFNGSMPGSKAILENLMESAKDAVNNISNIMSDEEQEGLWEDLASNDIKEFNKAFNLTNPRALKHIQEELDNIQMNMNNVNSSIKKLLNNSLSYFSPKVETTYENILEANNLDGLEDWVLLHPKLRKVFIQDIDVKETKKVGKINIYIDVSGSMTSACGVEDKNGKYISKQIFSKAFAYKMRQMNLLNDVYSFQSSVKAEGNNLHDILTITGGGGTDINKVVLHVHSIEKNAIVITDAEDYCNKYSPYVFFIGVKGARFNTFTPGVLKQYKENNQIILFDGKNVIPLK